MGMRKVRSRPAAMTGEAEDTKRKHSGHPLTRVDVIGLNMLG